MVRRSLRQRRVSSTGGWSKVAVGVNSNALNLSDIGPPRRSINPTPAPGSIAAGAKCTPIRASSAGPPVIGSHGSRRIWNYPNALTTGGIARIAFGKRSWSEQRSSFVATFGGDQLDASLLTLADLGFVPAEDPKFAATLAAVENELKQGSYVFRYTSSDDFGTPETAFNICTFWYINALAAVGRKDEARELFSNMLNRRNALGLLSEDLDPERGELLGELSANLQHGRRDHRSHAPEPVLGRSPMRDEAQ